jgi:hypothetical protein
MLFIPGKRSQLQPSTLLTIGIISLSVAVVSTCTGKTLARGSGWVYRAKEPDVFWWVVAIYYLGALLFVVLYLLN